MRNLMNINDILDAIAATILMAILCAPLFLILIIFYYNVGGF